MRQTMYLVSIFVLALVCFLTACDEPQNVASYKKQSELNKDIVENTGSKGKYYYNEWDSTYTYPSVLGLSWPAFVVEYEVEGCPKVAVYTINKFPYEICKKGTTIHVNDIQRYTAYNKSDMEYLPLRLTSLYINTDSVYNILKDEELVNQKYLTWHHVGESRYELKFLENLSSDSIKFALRLDYDRPTDPVPNTWSQLRPGFPLFFTQLPK